MKKLISLYTLAGILSIQFQSAFSQANRQLNNILTTKINSNLLPATNGTLSIGSASKTWFVLQLSETVMLNGTPVLRIPGSGNLLIGNIKNTTLTGTYNLLAGFGSGQNMTTGKDNTAIGANSLNRTTTGYSNTVLGYSMGAITTGYSNTSLGTFNVTGTTSYNNVVIGTYANYGNNNGVPDLPTAAFNYQQNTIVGNQSLYRAGGGSNNLTIGAMALFSNTGGSHNSGIGYRALYSNTIGEYNLAIGYLNSSSNVSANFNTSVGAYALFSNKTGTSNVAVGWEAMYYGTGSSNTAAGYRAMHNITTGNYNTAIGYEAGKTHKTGSYMTFIGTMADASAVGFSESTAIGFNSRITASKQIRFGNSFTAAIGGSRSWSNVSDTRLKTEIEENVPGLAFINKLRPVIYTVDEAAADNILNIDQSAVTEQQDGIAEARQFAVPVKSAGFIAQDVEKAARAAGFDFDGIDLPQHENDLYGIRYALFVVPLVKAVQELDEKQQQKAETVQLLKKQLSELKEVYRRLIQEDNY